MSIRVLFVCILILLNGQAMAFNASGIIWQEGETQYKTRLFNNPSETIFRNAFGDALDIWSNNSTFQYEEDSSTSADPCNNLANGISIAATSCGVNFGANVLAVHSAVLVNGVRTRSRIVFNSSVNWGVFNGVGGGGQIDFRRTAVHELGHGVGLGHVADTSAIMFQNITSVEVPNADDLNGVASMYDLDGDDIGFANDNCPDDVNNTQDDFDLDGEGDACDADIDGDGVFNSGGIDQSFSTINLSNRFFFLGEANSNRRFAQTFTVGISGVLDQLSLPVFCDSNNLQISIQSLTNGEPSGTVLDSVTFSNGTNQGFVEINLNGVVVAVNSQLAIVVTSTGECNWIRRQSGFYAGGSGQFSSTGANWNALTNGEDLPFSTNVTPMVLDNCPTVPNPGQDPGACLDDDADGVFNGLDNCPGDSNSDQLDFDSDGDGDVCDADIDGDSALNPNDSDDFNRFICSDDDADSCDDCSRGTFNVNNDGADTDGNGICNLTDPDDDGDGVLDGADNCPVNANPLQEDENMDGIGDACEPGFCLPIKSSNSKVVVICL